MLTNRKSSIAMSSRKICLLVGAMKYCSVILALRLYHIAHAIVVAHREFKTWQVTLPTWLLNRYNHRLAPIPINIPFALYCRIGFHVVTHSKDRLWKFLTNFLFL